MIDLNGRVAGPKGAPPIVLLHGLGMDASVFDALTLPDHRTIAPDLRGHGKSPAPKGPYAMGALVKDAEGLLDRQSIKDAVVVGLGTGGLIAQGLAVKRFDLVRGLILCGTAAKFGQPDPWHAMAETTRTNGMQAVAPDLLKRWNSEDVPEAEERLLATDPEGFAATCEAIAGTDFYTPTSGLRLPTLGLGGDRDRLTPPDLVRETTGLIPGSTFHLIRRAGHLAPKTHALEITDHMLAFLKGIGHQ